MASKNSSNPTATNAPVTFRGWGNEPGAAATNEARIAWCATVAANLDAWAANRVNMLRQTACSDPAKSIAIAANAANKLARTLGCPEPVPGYGAEGHFTRYTARARFPGILV